ncbi:MAG: twin-arginine translocase subunit TatC [Acidobacteria bacterium]|nr:MAG: twin-arginine translocase subunit TatC [Acidobacteriota bacterium]
MAASRPDPNKMNFLEHLDELRRRLFIMVVSVAVGFGGGWLVHNEVLRILMAPVQANLPEGLKPVFTTLTEPFMLAMKVSFFVGLIAVLPVLVLQIWLFISPGLFPNERRYAVPFIFFGSGFFFLGCWFGYAVVFPYAARFLIGFAGDQFAPMLTISRIFGFEMRLILSMGAVFQMPVFIFLLARLGLVSAGFLWRNIKYAVLIICILAAILTPTPDAVTMALVAGPMLGLYVLGILVALVFGRRSKPTEDAENSDDDEGEEDGSS